MIAFRVALAILSLPAAGGLLAAQVAAPPVTQHPARVDHPRVTNLGLAFGQANGGLAGNVAPFLVSEGAQGADLNGDGDTTDFVLHVTDTRYATTTNLGLAASGSTPTNGTYVAVRVQEEAVDLNGDGDVFDSVVHLVEHPSGTVTNLGFAARQLWMGAHFVAFDVAEGALDLNGDGDLFDDVIHVHDFVTGTTRNLQVVAPNSIPGFPDYVRAHGGHLALGVHENSQGRTDLNGDGDFSDDVLHVYDVAADLVLNTQLDTNRHLVLGDEAVACVVGEFEQGGDLNGDGDVSDAVLHVVRLSPFASFNSGLAVHPAGTLAIFGTRAACAAPESAGGVDLNGDGDLADSVVVSYDPVLGLGGPQLAVEDPGEFEASGGLLAVPVSEAGQGMDLDGDGDQLDDVLHVHDLATGATNNLQLTAIPSTSGRMLGINRGWVDFTVSETTSDLNGDGDTVDLVRHFYDTRTGVVTNTELAVTVLTGKVRGGPSTALFQASELAQGADLNGDGDQTDLITIAFDRRRAKAVNLGLSAAVSGVTGRSFLTHVSENATAPGVDLNGDGDTGDRVFHLLRF